MFNKTKKGVPYYLAVISHKRPENVPSIMSMVGTKCTFYVNKGEGPLYSAAGAPSIAHQATNICEARNAAIIDANGEYCVQVSDDLKRIKVVKMDKQMKRVQKVIDFEDVVDDLIETMHMFNSSYAGVGINSNPLNYTGKDYSYDKLVVNDLIVVKDLRFDATMSLKEDYDLCLQQLTKGLPVIRANKFLCEFPHRENKGGANTYRNEKTELAATRVLKKKWGPFIQDHKTRPGQVQLNYSMIEQAATSYREAIKQSKRKHLR